MMAAGFERHVGSSALSRNAGRLQRMHFGVRLAGTLVPAFANDDAIAHDDAADTGIGSGGQQPTLGQLQRTRHEFVVGGAEHGHRQLSISGRDG